MLIFELISIDGNKYTIDKASAYELSKDADAACDGLRIYYDIELLDEIERVLAYDNGKLIFNGFCDTQRDSADDDGTSGFIYARSSACLLTDNQANPFTYTNPSALSLFYSNAKQFGFSCALPNVYCTNDYEVCTGTTCYGAINDFIKQQCGVNFIVDESNRLCLPDDSTVINIENSDILNCKRIINRSAPISQIDFKVDNDNGYTNHMRSTYFYNKNISRSKKISLASVPLWRRQTVAKNAIKSSADSYYTIQFDMQGFVMAEPYNCVRFSGTKYDNEEFYVSSVVHTADDSGERTRITVSKSIELGEILYVD